MFFRKIGKFLRGKATPFQITSATVLGALLGSLPGVSQGPLLLLCLLFLLIILNANLLIAGLTLLLMKLVSLLLLPLYFKLGVWLLEGPLAGPVSVLANTPVTAWFGLDYYVTVPSLITGLIAGLVIGIGLSRALNAFRRKMGSLESGSERYQAYTSKPWVKGLAWLLVGGIQGKKSWDELGSKRIGMPVRPLGIILVVSLLILGFVGFQLLDRTIITSTVRDALERVNGATVDITGIEIQPAGNRIVVTGLAMADPEDLQTNRFATREIISDVSGVNLLAKKVVIDSLRVIEPESGTPRKLMGRRTVKVPEPEPDTTGEGEVDIEGYLGMAKVWRERLATAKRIYDRIAPHLKKDEEAVEDGGMTWREQLEMRAREAGYAYVQAESLIRNSPRLWIRDLQADNLVVGGNDLQFLIEASNISTQPSLVADSGRIRIMQETGELELIMELPSAENPTRSVVKIRYDGLPVSQLEEEIGRDLPMDGGTMDLRGEGTIDGGQLDIPVSVTFNGSTLNAFGSSLPLDGIPIEVRVHGPIERPKLAIPEDAIKEAVQKGGLKQIENLIEDKAGDELKKLLPFGGD